MINLIVDWEGFTWNEGACSLILPTQVDATLRALVHASTPILGRVVMDYTENASAVQCTRSAFHECRARFFVTYNPETGGLFTTHITNPYQSEEAVPCIRRLAAMPPALLSAM